MSHESCSLVPHARKCHSGSECVNLCSCYMSAKGYVGIMRREQRLDELLRVSLQDGNLSSMGGSAAVVHSADFVSLVLFTRVLMGIIVLLHGPTET